MKETLNYVQVDLVNSGESNTYKVGGYINGEQIVDIFWFSEDDLIIETKNKKVVYNGKYVISWELNKTKKNE